MTKLLVQLTHKKGFVGGNCLNFEGSLSQMLVNKQITHLISLESEQSKLFFISDFENNGNVALRY